MVGSRCGTKKHRLVDAEAPGKRLRDNLVDLFASGDVPGDRSQSLLNDAADIARSVGSHELQDLRGASSLGSGKNQARDLGRRLLRRSLWPPLYEDFVRCWSVKGKQIVAKKVAFLLPHEILSVLHQTAGAGVLQQTEGLDPSNASRTTEIANRLGRPFISVSLWGDGVAFSWDRKRSVDCWTMSLPGLANKNHRDLRIPLVGIPHQWVCRETQDDIFQILAWSFSSLARDKFPTSRFDGSDWLPTERSGSDVPPAALVEIKGDWKQMSARFSVPDWVHGLGKPICWR